MSLPMLLFRFAGEHYGVRAEKIETVLHWQEPVPLPEANTPLRGVLKEREQLIAVLASLGGKRQGQGDKASRILVCPTEHGHVGLPADLTLGIEQAGALPASGARMRLGGTEVIYLDPEVLAQNVVGG